MDATADIEADLQGLGRLAERALGLAMRYADRIEALPADDDERAVSLARSFEGAARSYRQSLALKGRLRRELEVARQPAKLRALLGEGREVPLKIELKRRAQLEDAVRPLIWSEHEGSEAEMLEEEMSTLVDEAFDEDDGFGERPLDVQAREIARRLGLEPRSAPAKAKPKPKPKPKPEATPKPAAELPEPPPERLAGPAPPASQAQPAPPPAPPPYLPPWERAPPGAVFRGGSGW